MITRHDIAFMVQEIISECHSRPKGAEMIDLIDKYADKFGKDNNALVPLDEEEVANTLVDAHGILNKYLLKKEYYLPYAKTICAKFGKDNNWMSEYDLQIARETVGFLHTKSISVFPDSTKEIFKERARIIQKLIDSKFSQQPPKEQADTCNCHIDDDDGNINYCEKHEPKERKVSLEEIKIIKSVLDYYNLTEDGFYTDVISEEIAKRLNAKESTEKES